MEGGNVGEGAATWRPGEGDVDREGEGSAARGPRLGATSQAVRSKSSFTVTVDRNLVRVDDWSSAAWGI